MQMETAINLLHNTKTKYEFVNNIQSHWLIFSTNNVPQVFAHSLHNILSYILKARR